MRENVLIYGRYFGLSRRELKPRIDELLDFVQLTERAGDKVEPLSGGMKRRLTIARSLVNDPDLLLLDEPTTGLDPQARHVVWDRLFRLKQQGKTFVVTTHYMDEAEQLCDRLVVMDHGAIVAEGSPWELIQRYSTREVVEVRFEDERPQNGVFEGVAERVEELPDRVLLYTRRRRRDRDRRSPSAGCRRIRRSSGAARSRTSSSTSPAARWSTDVESVLQPLRAYEHWLAQYRRVWRGTIGTSLVNPILYVTALGVGLGTIVDQTQNTPGGVPYLDYVAPGPARRRRDADRHDRVELAGDGRDQVVARLPRDDRDAADRAGRVRRPPAVRDHARLHRRLPPTSSSIAAFGAVASWWGILVVPVAVLIGTAFSMPMAALAARVEDDRTFVTIFRFLIVPMFLFSGTFFPISQLPLAFELIAYVTPIWHGVELCRMLTLGTVERLGRARAHRLPARLDARRLRAGAALVPPEAARMTTLVHRALELPGGRGIHLFERNVMSHRRTWPIIVSGFFEPLFYLLSLGYGLGGYVGDVVIDGQPIEYAAVRRAGAARRVGVQRRLLRRDQHLLEAPLPEGLRRRPRDAARAEGHRRRGDGVRALPRASSTPSASSP